MAVTAQAGTVGFGPQPAMGTLATTWYRHRATMVDLAIQDPVNEGAPEVGGLPVPTFPYKTGPMVGGGLTLQPRLQDTLGWLLHGVMGDVTSTESPGASGLYNHVFTMLSGQETYVPWMSFRKHIPRRNNAADTDLGEIYKDCKVMGFMLQLPNGEPLTARVDVSGREFSLDHDPTLWTWDNTFEPWNSIPVACSVGGYLNIDSVEMPVVQASVGFQNVPLDPRQEKVYGSPYLEDITVLQRRLVYNMTVKWNDPDLYAEVVTNGPTGTSWNSAPKVGALSVKAVSSVDMTGETEPWSLMFDADEVMMSLQGGITLAGNQAVMMNFQGVALETGGNYGSITLRNKIASYAWPSS